MDCQLLTFVLKAQLGSRGAHQRALDALGRCGLRLPAPGDAPLALEPAVGGAGERLGRHAHVGRERGQQQRGAARAQEVGDGRGQRRAVGARGLQQGGAEAISRELSWSNGRLAERNVDEWETRPEAGGQRRRAQRVGRAPEEGEPPLQPPRVAAGRQLHVRQQRPPERLGRGVHGWRRLLGVDWELGCICNKRTRAVFVINELMKLMCPRTDVVVVMTSLTLRRWRSVRSCCKSQRSSTRRPLRPQVDCSERDHCAPVHLI